MIFWNCLLDIFYLLLIFTIDYFPLFFSDIDYLIIAAFWYWLSNIFTLFTRFVTILTVAYLPPSNIDFLATRPPPPLPLSRHWPTKHLCTLLFLTHICNSFVFFAHILISFSFLHLCFSFFCRPVLSCQFWNQHFLLFYNNMTCFGFFQENQLFVWLLPFFSAPYQTRPYFLAVQDSSIGDLVTHWVSRSCFVSATSESTAELS